MISAQCPAVIASPSMIEIARSPSWRTAPGGCTEAVMAVHGFTIMQLVELVQAGPATARAGASAAASMSTRWRG